MGGYYAKLLDIGKDVYLKSPTSRALHAVACGLYDPGSVFATWLVTLPQITPLMLDRLTGWSAQRGDAALMLARIVAAKEEASKRGQSEIFAGIHANDIHKRLRNMALTETEAYPEIQVVKGLALSRGSEGFGRAQADRGREPGGVHTASCTGEHRENSQATAVKCSKGGTKAHAMPRSFKLILKSRSEASPASIPTEGSVVDPSSESSRWDPLGKSRLKNPQRRWAVARTFWSFGENTRLWRVAIS